jgi:Rhs element Vgr protein
VSIGGETLPRNYKLVEFVVVKEINRISYAKLVFADGDPSTGVFDLSNSDWMDNGKEMTISCGYEGTNETVFEGIVWNHRITLKNEQSLLQVEARDKAVLLTMSEKNKVFEEMNDGDVIEEIGSRNNYQTSIDASFDVEHEKVVQYACTDWDFIVARAEANAAFCRTEKNTLEVFEIDTNQEAKIELVLGATILELDTEISGENQHEGLERSGWSFQNQESVLEEADAEIEEAGTVRSSDIAEQTGAKKESVHISSISNERELTLLANAEATKHKLSKLMGSVKSEGFADIKPGEMIKLAGIAEKFNGDCLVSGVAQIYKNGNWLTKYQLGFSAESHLERFKPISKKQFVLPTSGGLEIGKVQEIVDGEGENRIKINIAAFGTDTGIWARIANLDAGDSRGSFFRPEVGDEVVVGFLNNDPRAPIILGMLNSSALPPPEEAEEANDLKGFVSRSGMKITFHDGDKSIDLETPSGNRIQLSEDTGGITLEDENGNKVLMDSDGITMESARNLNIKASGDIKIEGTNIDLAATANFKAEGSAGAEMSTSAVAVVKGSLVQIN